MSRRNLFQRVLAVSLAARLGRKAWLLDYTKLPSEPMIHGVPAHVWQAVARRG